MLKAPKQKPTSCVTHLYVVPGNTRIGVVRDKVGERASTYKFFP